MKNVRMTICLMLVLGMASLANATINFSCPTGTNVNPGQTVAVQIISPDQDITSPSGYKVDITESKTSAAGYATATALGTLNAGFNYQVMPGNLRNAMTNFGTGTPRFMLIDRISAGVIDPAPPIPAGSVLYQFNVLIPALAAYDDTFTITAAIAMPVINPPPAPYQHLIDGLSVTTTNALVLHVVPEPATIALLGLGAVLLRKRKK